MLLVRPETGETEPGDGVAAGTKLGRWRYVGPPGDFAGRARPAVRSNAAAVRSNAAAAPDVISARQTGRTGPGRGNNWPHNLMGTNVQSKSAGLSGLASLVEAAGGESTG